MKEFTYTITDEQGIHARPAGLLVKEAAGFASAITIEKDGKKVQRESLALWGWVLRKVQKSHFVLKVKMKMQQLKN